MWTPATVANNQSGNHLQYGCVPDNLLISRRKPLILKSAIFTKKSESSLLMIERYGFIKARRGNITIVDRYTLIDFADGMYGTPEAEYRRLIGPFG